MLRAHIDPLDRQTEYIYTRPIYDLRRPEYRLLEVKNPLTRQIEVKKLVVFQKTMCHFAMTQAFSAQADGTGATQMG